TVGQPGEQWGVHGDDGVDVEPEGVVGPDAAGGRGTLARAAPRGEGVGAGVGVQSLRERLRASAVPDRADGTSPAVSVAVVEHASAHLLPDGSSAALLSQGSPKSESGCSDPR